MEDDRPIEEQNIEGEVPQTSEPAPHTERGRMNFGVFFIGMICMALGIAYLLDISGVLYLTLDIRLSYFLPLAIIFIGLSLLSRASKFSYFIGFLVTIASIITIGNTVVKGASVESSRHNLETQSITIPKAAATDQALIYVTMGDGDIAIKGGAGDDLVRGEFSSNFTYLIPEDAVEDTIQGVSLGSEGTWQGFGKQVNSFDLTINKETPLRLYLGASTAKMDIDLTGTLTEYVGIRAQGANIRMKLDKLVPSQALEFNAPESILAFEIPKSSGVQVLTTPKSTLKKATGLDAIEDTRYESKNFDIATEKIIIKLVAPISELTIAWK